MLDLCTGGHLGDLIKRMPQKYLAEDNARVLIRQLVSAVAHMHSRGICHRDIKLQNILLENMDDTHAQLKLIDFGFAARFLGVTPLKTRCGTPYATAPEVYREEYDERCDVWSVGVVTYVLLSGHRPFSSVDLPGDLKNAGRAAMVTNILMARYHFNFPAFQSVSAEGITFVQNMLHGDYTTRWSARDALNSKWLSNSAVKTHFDFNLLKENDTALSLAVSNLKTKHSVSSLGNTSMVAVAFSRPQGHAGELRTLFQSFDAENLGYLSKESFRKAMKSVSPDLSNNDIDQLFVAIDVDNDHQISFTEFLAATMDPREVDMDELSKAFKLLDVDNKGYLTTDDFYRVLASNYSANSTKMQLKERQGSYKGASMDDSSKTTDHDFNNSKKRNDSASSDEISKSGPIWFNDEADGDAAHSERERKHLLQKIAKMIKSAGE